MTGARLAASARRPEWPSPSLEMLPFPDVVHGKIQILTHPLQIINDILTKRYAMSISLLMGETASFAGIP